MTRDLPSRGDIWLVDFSPTRGHEQAGVRPGLVASVNAFNQGPSGLVVLVPLTTNPRRIRFHVPIPPPEGGVREPSFVKCEDVRSVSRERLLGRWGSVSGRTMLAVADRLRILLDL